MKARVITVSAPGDPSVMELATVEMAPPGPGEAQVRQTAIGLNYIDTYHRSGLYPLALPSGIGVEAAGVVEAVGDGVSELAPGDRVAYGGGAPGGYAEVRNVAADRLVRIPDAVGDEQAAAILMKGMTVQYLLMRTYPVRRGEFALFYAAAGGVGLIAGQWGKAIGARMIGVAGGAEKCQLALAHGYEAVIDRKSEDVVARVKELTGGEGLPVVYDSIGKDTFDQSIECLAPRGYFVSFGSASGLVPPVDPSMLQKKGSLYFTRPTLVTYTAKRADLVASAEKVFSMVATGVIKPDVRQRYAFADAVKAHVDLEAGRTTGSSLLIP